MKDDTQLPTETPDTDLTPSEFQIDIDLELVVYSTKDFNRDEWKSKWVSAGEVYKQYFEQNVNTHFLMNPDEQLDFTETNLIVPGNRGFGGDRRIK
jgi:hypothetical protein